MDENVTTRWWLVRHAPVTVAKEIIYGANEVPCDLSDTVSFAALAKRLPGDVPWLTSHLGRARQTAQTIRDMGRDMGRDAGLVTPDAVVDQRFGEQSLGDWQGKTWDDMRTAESGVQGAFWSNSAHNRPPNGESFVDQIARVGEAIDDYTARHRGCDIVCVSHGGTIRAALSHVLDFAPETAMKFSISTLSLSVVEHIPGPSETDETGHWRAVYVNRPAKEDP